MAKIIVNDIEFTAMDFQRHNIMNLHFINMINIGEYRPTDNKLVIIYEGETYTGYKDLMHYDNKSNTTRFVLHWE